MTKLEFYKKLSAKLQKIKSGEITLDHYINEVNFKIKLLEKTEDFTVFADEEKAKSTDPKKIWIISSYLQDGTFDGYLYWWVPNGTFAWGKELEKAQHFNSEDECIFKNLQSWKLGREGGEGFYLVRTLHEIQNTLKK